MKHLKLFFIQLLMMAFSIIAKSATLVPEKFPLYVYSSETEPVMLACQYLNRDYEKVTGQNFLLRKVSAFADIPKEQWAVVILNNTDGFPDLPKAVRNKVTGYESHRVYKDVVNKRIILQGYDMRGTIYAIYTFSELVLGVPPLWFWSSWKPQVKANLEIPDDLDIFFDVPDVKYRSFFPNDTDLFSPFLRINEETKSVWVETMMRLKLNTTEQNTVIDLPNKTLNEIGQIIKRHGMVLTSHHQTILNVEFSKWREYWQTVRQYKKIPELLLANEKELLEFWRYSVEIVHKSGIENVWVIGLRGNGDTPFWASFADAPSSSQERAEVINHLFGKQLDIIRDVTGNLTPEVRIILYNELADLYKRGFLKPPVGDNVILTFSAVRQDPYPGLDLVNFSPNKQMRIGYYMNLQFYTSGCHLTQGEGPWKMESNYNYVFKKNNTKLDYSVLNVGNLREFFLTVAANAKMMWNVATYNTDNFLADFCQVYFGKECATEVAALYHDFFYAFWEQRKSSFPAMERQFIFQDLRIKSAIERLYEIFPYEFTEQPLLLKDKAGRSYQIKPEDNGAATQLGALINGMENSILRWEEVTATSDKLYSRLPKDAKIFFNDNLRTQAHFMHQISISFLKMLKAYKFKSDKQRAASYLDTAYVAMSKAKCYLYEAQHDIFKDWYKGDSSKGGKFNIPLMESYISELGRNMRQLIVKEVKLLPIADTYTSCNATDKVNHGEEKYLRVRKDNSDPSKKYNAYIKFDLASLGIDLKRIVCLEFGIYKRKGGLSSVRQINISTIAVNHWDEKEFNGWYRGRNESFCKSSAISYFTKKENEGERWYKIIATPTKNRDFYKAIIETKDGLITLRLYPDEKIPANNDDSAVQFFSRDNDLNQPYLRVSYADGESGK